MPVNFDYKRRMDIPETFLSALKQEEISVSPDQLEKLSAYVERMLEVNRHLNLTAVRDWDSAWIRHIFDSLLLLKDLKQDEGQQALDLGSGGGLPGIPLAICRPDMRWMLVDSVGKKARFLEETAAELDLQNVAVSSARAEILGKDDAFREQFHVVCARAVARLPVLLEYVAPLCRLKGHVLAMKGEQAPVELKEARRAIEVLGLRLQEERPQPGGGILLRFRKQKPCPGRYPRKVGIPLQQPL